MIQRTALRSRSRSRVIGLPAAVSPHIYTDLSGRTSLLTVLASVQMRVIIAHRGFCSTIPVPSYYAAGLG